MEERNGIENRDYKKYFSGRDLRAFSIRPYLAYPSHYAGDAEWMSDTEFSTIWDDDSQKTTWSGSQKTLKDSRGTRHGGPISHSFPTASRDELKDKKKGRKEGEREEERKKEGNEKVKEKGWEGKKRKGRKRKGRKEKMGKEREGGREGGRKKERKEKGKGGKGKKGRKGKGKEEKRKGREGKRKEREGKRKGKKEGKDKGKERKKGKGRKKEGKEREDEEGEGRNRLGAVSTRPFLQRLSGGFGDICSDRCCRSMGFG
ncbi:Glycosyltransferase 25 family member 3, partial [Ophiophagus hannah]